MNGNLKGIVIDPGHGGTDPGASGNGIIEKDWTLRISEYMYDRFNELGVPVSITREEDVTLEPNDRTNKVESFYGNGNNVLVISNHINAGGGEGAEVIYALRNDDTLSKTIAEEIEKEGQTVRKYYQRRLPSNPAKDYYFMLRDTANNESVIVEYGFLDTASDAERIKNNWQDYAEAVVRAVSEYAGINYIPKDSSEYYVVQKGDSLWTIAKKFGLTINDLKAINNLDSNLIHVGDTLKVKPEETGITTNTYKVQSGDTLYQIAQKFNTTVDNLKSLNNLTSNTLSINQILKVGDNAPTTTGTYTVKAGDTLYQIAQKFNTTVENLKNLNNLTSNTLSIGQVLKVGDNAPTTTGTYIVKAGDSLYKISQLYGISVDELKNLNNLTNNTLSIGQVLKVPQQKNQVYTVVAGDNLYQIAQKFGTTVTAIVNLNNLATSNLSIGQKLLIP